MHLKSSNGAPINVLVLNQDEGVAEMVPMPKYPRIDRQHTATEQEETSSFDKGSQHQEEGASKSRTGQLDEDPTHDPQRDRIKRTNEIESSMDVDQVLSESPDRSDGSTPQKSLAAIVERLHSNNEEKSSQDDLASGERVWSAV